MNAMLVARDYSASYVGTAPRDRGFNLEMIQSLYAPLQCRGTQGPHEPAWRHDENGARLQSGRNGCGRTAVALPAAIVDG